MLRSCTHAYKGHFFKSLAIFLMSSFLVLSISAEHETIKGYKVMIRLLVVYSLDTKKVFPVTRPPVRQLACHLPHLISLRCAIRSWSVPPTLVSSWTTWPSRT